MAIELKNSVAKIRVARPLPFDCQGLQQAARLIKSENKILSSKFFVDFYR